MAKRGLSSWCAAALAGGLLLPGGASAQAILVDEDVAAREGRQAFIIPYAFHSDVIATAFGIAAGGRGILQEQDGLVINQIASTNGSIVTYLFGEAFRTPWTDRLFLSPRIMVGDFGAIDTYQDGNPEFPFERAGSNGSHEDNFIRSEGTDQWYRLGLRYVAPLGHGKDAPIPTYLLERGLLKEGAAGATSWNPLRSGRTLVELEPFYRGQDFDADLGSDELETGGVRLTLRHENVDFLPNPTRGSVKQLSVIYDWGVQDADSSYTLLELELAKYFDLGESDRFRQRVLALGFWTADTPTWEVDRVGGAKVVTHRPPAFFGATLGGVSRLRGFPTARFNDKAAILYSAELRLVPRWHPLGDVAWIRRFARVDWWQAVGFAELGRVSEHWSVSELHSHMKWSAGVGLRFFVNHLVVRADVAFSHEGGEVQMMVSHPFPSL
jgi:hypothetical protein